MRIISLELGPFEARAVIVVDETSREAVIVDPGFEITQVIARVRAEGVRPVAIVITHAHVDHAFGAAEAKAAFPEAPLLVHADDAPMLGHLPMQASMFGLPEPPVAVPDRLLVDGDRVTFGTNFLLVRHSPGHSPGHVVLIGEDEAAPVAIVGDVLFAGEIGRTDLWGGSYPALERSIREVLYRLPDHTRVIPGHGPETTIGKEKATNPYVAEP